MVAQFLQQNVGSSWETALIVRPCFKARSYILHTNAVLTLLPSRWPCCSPGFDVNTCWADICRRCCVTSCPDLFHQLPGVFWALSPSGNCCSLKRAAYFKVTPLIQGQPISNDGLMKVGGKSSPLVPTGDNSQFRGYLWGQLRSLLSLNCNPISPSAQSSLFLVPSTVLTLRAPSSKLPAYSSLFQSLLPKEPNLHQHSCCSMEGLLFLAPVVEWVTWPALTNVLRQVT